MLDIWCVSVVNFFFLFISVYIIYLHLHHHLQPHLHLQDVTLQLPFVPLLRRHPYSQLRFHLYLPISVFIVYFLLISIRTPISYLISIFLIAASIFLFLSISIRTPIFNLITTVFCFVFSYSSLASNLILSIRPFFLQLYLHLHGHYHRYHHSH